MWTVSLSSVLFWLQDDDKDDDYENAPHGNQYNINMGPIHNRPFANPYKSDLVYENFDSNTNQSDFIYENVNITNGWGNIT